MNELFLNFNIPVLYRLEEVIEKINSFLRLSRGDSMVFDTFLQDNFDFSPKMEKEKESTVLPTQRQTISTPIEQRPQTDFEDRPPNLKTKKTELPQKNRQFPENTRPENDRPEEDRPLSAHNTNPQIEEISGNTSSRTEMMNDSATNKIICTDKNTTDKDTTDKDIDTEKSIKRDNITVSEDNSEDNSGSAILPDMKNMIIKEISVVKNDIQTSDLKRQAEDIESIDTTEVVSSSQLQDNIRDFPLQSDSILFQIHQGKSNRKKEMNRKKEIESSLSPQKGENESEGSFLSRSSFDTENSESESPKHYDEKPINQSEIEQEEYIHEKQGVFPEHSVPTDKILEVTKRTQSTAESENRSITKTESGEMEYSEPYEREKKEGTSGKNVNQQWKELEQRLQDTEDNKTMVEGIRKGPWETTGSVLLQNQSNKHGGNQEVDGPSNREKNNSDHEYEAIRREQEQCQRTLAKQEKLLYDVLKEVRTVRNEEVQIFLE